MGYRSRLGRIAKSERTKFKGKSHDECQRILDDKYPEMDYVSLYYPPEHEQFIELGKYCRFDIQPEPFYDGFDIQEECESEFHILTPDQLKQIIKEYQQNIFENYQGLINAFENPESREAIIGDFDVKRFLQRRANEWNIEINDRYLDQGIEMTPFYLDTPIEKRDGLIARSWQFEYQIFNLTFIYSTFDWDSDYLIYSAW